jgi:hypothetical protein
MSSVERRKESSVQFLGEQDGAPERPLKSALSRRFQGLLGLQRAYLVRVRYTEVDAVQVALAVVADSVETGETVKLVQEVFSSQFNCKECLDVLFIPQSDEARLSPSCRPFFTASVC